MIKLYNTHSRSKEDFTPIDPADVRMYVCGPTVYDRAHLGNARPVIVFDILNRVLRHAYGNGSVTYVRNFTDVDDKINARSAQSGRSISHITDETIEWFLEDMRAVGADDPDAMPRATQYISHMVKMIEDLAVRGFAYARDGHVMFSVRKYEEYGSLSGRSVDDLLSGARVELAGYKDDPLDFILWKPSDEATPGWDGPSIDGVSVGRGRPGWHIECSAMSRDLLGDSFDIHGGGSDLKFPHHENEMAQSKCAGHGSANIWMHNEMLQVNGSKMSKSLGNFFTVRDLLDQGVPGEVIRFVFMGTHYRKAMDWTSKKSADAENTLRKWFSMVEGVSDTPPDEELLGFLYDDLGTSEAITHMHMLFNAGRSEDLRAAMKITGLLGDDIPEWTITDAYDFTSIKQILIEARRSAMETKDFTAVDRIKSMLVAAGVQVSMTKTDVALEVTSNFNPEMIISKLGEL